MAWILRLFEENIHTRPLTSEYSIPNCTWLLKYILWRPRQQIRSDQRCYCRQCVSIPSSMKLLTSKNCFRCEIHEQGDLVRVEFVQTSGTFGPLGCYLNREFIYTLHELFEFQFFSKEPLFDILSTYNKPSTDCRTQHSVTRAGSGCLDNTFVQFKVLFVCWLYWSRIFSLSNICKFPIVLHPLG